MENTIFGNVANDSLLHVLVGRRSPSSVPPFFEIVDNKEQNVALTLTFPLNNPPAPTGWVALHLAAWSIELVELPTWFEDWEKRSIPCGECRRHWGRYKESDPPDFGSLIGFFWWSYRAHNKVSRRIGKSVWSCGRFYRRYHRPNDAIR